MQTVFKAIVKAMKSASMIVAFMFLATFAKGQENGLQTKVIDELYSWGKKTSEQTDILYLSLHPVKETKCKIYIRVSLVGQSIDFYSFDNENYFGILTNYTSQYKSVKIKDSNYTQSKISNFIFEKIKLEQGLVDRAVKKLIASGQYKIPTDTLITSWKHNFVDCNSLRFEFNLNGNYVKQIFHCPWGQSDTIAYKNIILDNCQLLVMTFKLDSLYKNFENKLPAGKTYSQDGYMMHYIFTKQESEGWAQGKPMRDYMKSVKDTVDNYINASLEKQHIKLKDIDCFEDYGLVFGLNGKLAKISLSEYNKPKLKNSLGLKDFLADKREVRKCKKKIRKIFEEVDLGFLKMKYEIFRTFSFDYEGQYQLRDDTIY